MTDSETADLVVVGAGAAGLATAIFTARAARGLRVICLDGATRIGAKILVSGGSRCNVTNRIVTEKDFWGGSSRIVRRVLQAFPARAAADFFAALGVALHEEEDGKLFPDSNRSRTVLDALLAEATRAGVAIRSGERVVAVEKREGRFAIDTAGNRRYLAGSAVLATGGRSLPKTGSDGFGYELARRLGHGYVETTPALAPLLLGRSGEPPSEGLGSPDGNLHAQLSGVSHLARLTVAVNRRVALRLDGPLLWTHFGISGPVALDTSRHWHRARLEGADVRLAISTLPGETFETTDAWLQREQRIRPRAHVTTAVANRVPAAVAGAWAQSAGIAADTPLAHLTRDSRRRLAHALVDTALDVQDSRGYGFAEVTAGGIPLDEIDPATMQSRKCPGLYLTGELLDVDGRLGGFNFQWAWSSAWVAGHAIAAAAA